MTWATRGAGMLVGYMRVSKADGSQMLDLQRDALLAAGIDAGNLYEDLASGKRGDRQGLAACVKALRAGDTLAVWKLDRLGRDLRIWSTCDPPTHRARH
ncbi:partial DNA-invertase hin, partial [Methylococcales bacterium]